MSERLSAELVREREGLARLELAWDRLWAASDPPPPMLELTWIREWWQLHHSEGELFIIVVRDSEVPVGLAPLYIRRRDFSLPGMLHTVYFVGTGESELEEVHGEYTGWLCASEHRDAVTAVVARMLEQWRSLWDRIDLCHMGPDTVPAEQLQQLLTPVVAESVLDRATTYRVRVAPIDEYIAAIGSQHRRARFRKLMRDAEEARIEIVRAAHPKQAREMFAELVRLHERYWQQRGEPGACSSPVFRRFHERMFDTCWSKGRLWVLGLRQPKTGRWIALHYLIHWSIAVC